MDNEQTTDQAVNLGDEAVVAEKSQTEETVKTFTQEEVSGIAAKESKKAQEKLLKDLGIDDFNGAKDGLAKFREWQEAQKSEQEKQAEILTAKDKELANTLATNKLLEAKVAALSLGVQAGAIEDVIALSERLVKDDVTIEQAMQQVLEKYPQFGNVAEVKAEESKPTFTVGGSPAVQSRTLFLTSSSRAQSRQSYHFSDLE